MQEVQLFAKENLTVPSSGNFGIGLDCLNASPIKVTKSIQTIENPQTTTSNFTMPFRLPNTPTNAKFFKAAFNVNTVTFNATKKIEAYIMVDGVYFISGNIRLENIIYSSDVEKIEYSIVFMGETSAFGSTIASKALSDLNMSDLSHTLNYANLQLSWAGNLLNGNIVYPLAEYGYTYNDTTKVPTIPTLAVYNATTGVKGFTNSINPLEQNQLKPFVKLKYIWDKIFTDAGYTYTSSFLNGSEVFNKLYMVSSDTSSSNSTLAIRPDLLTETTAYANYFYTGFSDIPITFTNEVRDTANNWNPTSSTYTSISGGGTAGSYNYTFTVSNLQMVFSAPAVGSSPPTSYRRILFIKAIVETPTGTSTVGATGYVSTGTGLAVISMVSPIYSQDPAIYGSGASKVFNWNFNLIPGDKVRFFMYLGAEVSAGAYLLQGSLGATGPTAVDPAGLMPSQYKQGEFITGINDRFKLMWQPDKDNPKNFIIEPWVDWITKGETRDWTDKLDRNFDVTLTPLFQTQPREIDFKDSEEADLYNFSYQQQNKQTFGQLDQDSGIEIITGKREIKSMFAPMPLAPIGNSDKFIIPHFAKDTETERQPIQIKPRLAFYNGTGPAPITWYIKNDAGTAVAQTSYPIASSFNAYPFNSTVLDLNWTNVNQFWDVADYAPAGSGRTGNTAYSVYWSKWFNFTYSPYGRIMEATFVLTSLDLYELNFNDKIWIKDSWWLPIEVKDYELGQTKQRVKVKLVKLGDDVGVAINGPDDGIIYYPHTVTYGLSGCAACCGSEIAREITVYSTSKDFELSTALFLDPNGAITATIGAYTNGTEALNVNDFGVVQSVTLCSLCGCTGTLTAFSVCSATSVCGVCCCGSFTQTIYGDGATLATSKKIYGNSAGTMTLLPSRWYGTSSGTVAQVGSDGVTITAFGTCTGCVCGEIPPDA